MLLYENKIRKKSQFTRNSRCSILPMIVSSIRFVRRTRLSGSVTRQFTTVVPPKIEETPTPEAVPAVEPKKPLTIGRLLMYAAGLASTGSFAYYFYQAGGNLHKTEYLISKRLAELPFYYPPGPSQSERNSALPEVALSASFVDQISAWFISRDSALVEGLTREDVLTLCRSLGLIQEDLIEGSELSPSEKELKSRTSKFIEKGRGRLTEHKRLSGVSLPETIQYIDSIITVCSSDEKTKTAEEKLHAILEDLVSSPIAVPGSAFRSQSGALPEVEASDRAMLEMELEQAVQKRDQLNARMEYLSEAERIRLDECEENIKELEQLLVV